MSLKEIAKRANVSIGTVDRVIHNRGRVAFETKQNILKIAKEIHYKPNIYASNLALSKEFRFGIYLPKLNQESSFWNLHKKGIERALDELKVHKITALFTYFDRYSGESFTKAFQLNNADKLDGIIFPPIIVDKTKEILENIKNKIPYVFIDSDLPGSNYLTCISQDSFQSGVLAAKLMNILIKGKGRAVIIKVLPGDFHINERIRGFYSYMKNKNIKIDLLEVNSKNQDNFRKAAEILMGSYRDLKGIFVSNVWVHAMAKSLNEIVPDRKVALIGYDMVRQNIDQLKQGNIDFLISQRPELQGYTSVYSLYRKIVLKEKVERKITVPLDIITQENFAYFNYEI